MKQVYFHLSNQKFSMVDVWSTETLSTFWSFCNWNIFFPVFERSFCLDFSLSSTMTQGGHHELTTSFCLLCLPLWFSLFSPESMHSEVETKFSCKASVWIKGHNFFLNFILPLYYAAYQPHHFLFLSVVHSRPLPPHSGCSLHHLSHPTFAEFSCL